MINPTPNEVRELEEVTFSSNGCLLRRENGKEEGDSLLAHGKVGPALRQKPMRVGDCWGGISL